MNHEKRTYEDEGFVTKVSARRTVAKVSRGVAESMRIPACLVTCRGLNGNEFKFTCYGRDAPPLGSRVRLSASWEVVGE